MVVGMDTSIAPAALFGVNVDSGGSKKQCPTIRQGYNSVKVLKRGWNTREDVQDKIDLRMKGKYSGGTQEKHTTKKIKMD